MTVIYAFSRWGEPRFQFFALLCVAVSFYVVGYYIELTSTSLEGALIGCKIIYFGAPFTGSFFYLFARDFSDKSRFGIGRNFVLSLFPIIFTLPVFLYPDTNLYYLDLQFYTEMGLSDLLISPGIMYIPCFACVIAFTILGAAVMIRNFYREKRYKGALLFLAAIALPIVFQPIGIAKIMPYHYNPMPAALVVSVLLIGIYMMRYRQFEWQSVGRDHVVQSMSAAFLLLDRNRRLIDYNNAAAVFFPSINLAMMGEEIEKLRDFPVHLLGTNTEQQFVHQIGDRAACLQMTVSPLLAGENQVGTCIVIVDETERQQMLDELTRLARHDGLTGLNNRVTFFKDASLSFALIGRNERFSGCVLMLDIDNFKQVNDNYGHAAGDEVLRFIGEIFNNRLRATDISGRYGGEEFCIWMPATELIGARQVAETIRAIVQAKTFEFDGMRYSVTVSIGLACSRDAEPGDFADLVNKADNALYQAKNGGRNQVVTYTGACTVI